VPIGTRAYGQAGGEFLYIKAGASISANDAVIFSGSALGYDAVITSSAVDQFVIGVAEAAFASGDYGFVKTKGVVTCKVTVATAAGSMLVSDAVAGTMKLATATSFSSGRGAVALVTGVAAGSGIYLA
jgi:hypothetical protein